MSKADFSIAPSIASFSVETRDFAAIAVERGYCAADQITKAIQERDDSDVVTPQELSKLLIAKKILTPQQAWACARAARGATIIGGFEIMEKVGQGSMGAVFRARQISMDRIVAIKILPPKLALDLNFKKRFLHEARVSAKLSHLNIINGIDCGDCSGYAFFAMEFVDGQTVRQILKARGRLSIIDALPIIRQIVEALIYAKQHHLIHRDIKPDNIMVTANGVSKLCDLGLARQIHIAEDAVLHNVDEKLDIAQIEPRQKFSSQAEETRTQTLNAQKPPLSTILAPSLPPSEKQSEPIESRAALAPTTQPEQSVNVELPPPKLELTADVFYSRFLRNFSEHSAKNNLSRLQIIMTDLARKPEYKVAQDDIAAELSDLTAAINFERDALKAIIARGGEVKLTDETARKFGIVKAKAVSFDPSRGVELQFGNVGLNVASKALLLDDILESLPNAPVIAKLSYLVARGEIIKARVLAMNLFGDDKLRWLRKLDLLNSDEIELIAQLAFDNMNKMANAKSWKTLAKMADDFDKIYGHTRLAKQHAAQLRDWKIK